MTRTQDSRPYPTVAHPVPPDRMSMFFLGGFQQVAARSAATDSPQFLVNTKEEGRKINSLIFLIFLCDWTAVRFDLPERKVDSPEDDNPAFSSTVFIAQTDMLDSRFDNIRPVEPGYHLTLTNPPFSGTVQPQLLPTSLNWLKGSLKTETLFLARILQLLETGGRAGIVLPNGICFRSNKGYLELRRRLLMENQLEALISLPGGVFDPYSGIGTQLLIFRRGGQTESVWFYEIEAVEKDWVDLLLKYALHHGAPRPSFIDAETWQRWQAWSPAERSGHYACMGQDGEIGAIETVELPPAKVRNWITPMADILESEELNLTPNRHKPFVMEEPDYPHPLEILRELMEREEQISRSMRELYDMILPLYPPDDVEGQELREAMVASEAQKKESIESLLK